MIHDSRCKIHDTPRAASHAFVPLVNRESIFANRPTAGGYTLLEMLMVVSISTIVMGVIVSSILYFYRSNTNTLEQALQIENARRGITQGVRDIRETTYGDDGSYPIVAFATSTFTFYSDIDRDSSTERVRFFLEGSTLKKGVTNPTGAPVSYDAGNEQISIISEYVRNNFQNLPVFRYYTASSTEITSFATTTGIAFVEINLIVNVNPDRLPGEFTLRSSATLRNLKTNL